MSDTRRLLQSVCAAAMTAARRRHGIGAGDHRAGVGNAGRTDAGHPAVILPGHGGAAASAGGRQLAAVPPHL